MVCVRGLSARHCSQVYGASMGGAGKIFTAETAEMIGVNDHPEQSLRSPRALR